MGAINLNIADTTRKVEEEILHEHNETLASMGLFAISTPSVISANAVAVDWSDNSELKQPSMGVFLKSSLSLIILDTDLPGCRESSRPELFFP